MRRVLALTPGDPAGIGPEIVWKAVQSGIERELGVRLLCISAEAPFRKMGVPIRLVGENIADIGYHKPGVITLLPAPTAAPPGLRSRSSFSLPGFQSGWSIERAVRLAQEGIASALVTGPISKERFQAGGFPFPGHTEFLAHLCGTKKVVMMLANNQLRVTLATTHLSLANVPKALSAKDLEETIRITAAHLKKWWRIRRPRIAVSALNPHAGESGLFGNEEKRIIAPVIRKLQTSARGQFDVSGPHPADTFFAKHVSASNKLRDDAVVCMYHDQGLIPVKMLDFGGTVNVTLGLPLIRTSVDHGTGFDIAGKGIADPSSLIAAIRLAADLSKNRRSSRPVK